jgi:DNA-binding HxlR family transcriptional regulator
MEEGTLTCLGYMGGTAMVKGKLKRPAELEYTPTNCHARDVLARVGDTWSVYILHVLGDAKTLRFNELRREVDGISQRMLTVTLRGLERDGLVTRTVYPEVPPRVEYSLTPLGATLRQLIRGLVTWAGEHLAEVDSARATYDERHGPPRHVSMAERLLSRRRLGSPGGTPAKVTG